MAKDKAFRVAEKKIAEALRTRGTKLDLSCKFGTEDSEKLTELPESLCQLTQLQLLDLSNNQLKAMPESLVQLSQLRSLNLSDNQLTTLLEWLGQLTQLQTLDISDNQLTALPESLGHLTQLQTLDISNNQLKAMPESLVQLSQLRSLNLSDNQLTTLPEWLGQLTQLQTLDISGNQLTVLPEWIGHFTQLHLLELRGNQLTALPESLGHLTQLQSLNLSKNKLRSLPEWLGQLNHLQDLKLADLHLTELPQCLRSLTQLRELNLNYNQLQTLPSWIDELTQLRVLFVGVNMLTTLPDRFATLQRLEQTFLDSNALTNLPSSLANCEKLSILLLEKNPLNPELAAAYAEGLDAVKRYLRAKAEAQVVLNEAKLILIGEGEVGKSCLLGALRGDEWEEGKPTTHGIEIKPVKVTDPATGTEITLNGWDFGGQRVYRPTHQLFFTAPAVYLVVWKPREGSQAGAVKEWIKLVKHREPEAKILVVATHGGPKERQPDIDRQEIWDLFGKETVVDFLLVQSKPDEATGERHGIAELRDAIARVASGLPEMGRTFPQHWQEARTTLRGLLSLDAVLPLLGPLVRDEEEARARLQQLGENRLCLERAIKELRELVLDENEAREELSKARVAYLPLDRVFAICKEHKVEEEDARLLLRISRAVGDLIHYEHDPALRNIVILKPDWLATAMSFVLDDEHTRKVGHGLVSFERLGQLWNNPDKHAEDRYPSTLHPIFVRLMERFDLCYRVAEIGKSEVDGTSLIAQLVPDVRPDPVPGWGVSPVAGDSQQVQICKIVEAAKNQSATAEGIFYQLIVRLHKYSLGRADYDKSVHWQRGLLLQDNYGAKAFLEHIANDIRITVRSPYPERFLAALTYEIKWLVESFWEGLRCEVTVPCLAPQPDGKPCIGLFEVGKLLENKRRGRPEQPCPVCNEWQEIEQLLHNAPASRPNPLDALLAEFGTVKAELNTIRPLMQAHQGEVMRRFDTNEARIFSKVDDAFTSLIHTLLDEAKEGPRLFSFQPVERTKFNPKGWVKMRFRVTLWCEHSRLPLPLINKHDREGVYEFDVTRELFEKAAPFLKVLTGMLSLVLPVAASATKLAMEEEAYKAIENQLDFGKSCAEALLGASGKSAEWLGRKDAPELKRGEVIRAQGAVLRQLHAWLKAEDPTFGGLVRVQNKRQEFLWVHRDFEGEY
jgi:Leucine-rich repeat (LRR) protein